jgi:glutamyl-tRNA reductase
MASAAILLAERIYPSISAQSILFVGAGEMVELAAGHFAAHHPRRITFANRTSERAQQLADRFLGRVISLNDLASQLPVYDIVVSCTASPLPIIGKGLVESALRVRKHRPMLMFDLAVPRDVESEVAELDDVFLYTIDDLGKISREGMNSRRDAVIQAEVIVENEVSDFMHWLENRELVPMIRELRDAAERSRRHELDRALRRLQHGDDPRDVIESLSRALTNKLLHAPTHALNHAGSDEREALAATLARLYQIQRPQ